VIALLTRPGERGTIRLEDVAPRPAAGLRIRTLEVGVCGTDREIADGLFGVAPPDAGDLILGHELLGEVLDGGHGFAAGDLVTATVRRSCGACLACAEGSPDACGTGDYTERGITALDGFARELIGEDPDQIVAVPPRLGRLGVLAEPASISARAIRHSRSIGARQPWEPSRALVVGTGAIGVLAAAMLRLEGWDVSVAARGAASSEKARLAAAVGGRYVSTSETPLEALRIDVGGFDLVIEATGDADVMVAVPGLLRRNGVGCLLGLDDRRRPVALDSTVVGIDMVLENRVLFGSVNAHAVDWRTGLARLETARERWPEELEAFVGLRVAPDRFAEAFSFDGVKATLQFS
jgi:threonine dehydrogenase-like Zn-dependent dehydrogenase